jgi:hypothetical protein
MRSHSARTAPATTAVITVLIAQLCICSTFLRQRHRCTKSAGFAGTACECGGTGAPCPTCNRRGHELSRLPFTPDDEGKRH